MRIAVAFDERARGLGNALVSKLVAQGHDVLDLGTGAATTAGDHVSQTSEIVEILLSGAVDRAVLISPSALGASFVANKIPGIRAAVAADAYDARRSGENGVNLACLGLDLTPVEATEIVRAFLGAHVRVRPVAAHLWDLAARGVVVA